MADESELQSKVAELATELGVPGVAVGTLVDGVEGYAFHGVTSIENPLPVDDTTLFQFGSTGKTYTSTAMLRLVEQGQVDLAAPVRTHLPDFELRDEDVARRVTVRHLLNHTAGWEGDMMDSTGEGDDALTRYVARMGRLRQVTPLGSAVSYNNASLSVAGRIIEEVTGSTYEQAIRDLLFTPLKLDNTFFFVNEIMTRRFSVGHTRDEDGLVTVARPWAMPRGNSPAGGISATAHDQIAWARFHLGDGTAPDGTRLLSTETLELMRQPTAEMRGSALCDYVGISRLLRDVQGVRLVGHGGDTIGQHSDFMMVPERGFALISMTNCGPNGPQFNDRLATWALEHYLGLMDADPEQLLLDDATLAQYVGRFETISSLFDITARAGRLMVNAKIKPEMAAVLREAGEDVPEHQPAVPLTFIAQDPDRYVVPDGDARGMRGYFSRDSEGHVDGIHLGGRLAIRLNEVSA